MTITDWLLFIAVIDGPLIGFIYLIWQKLNSEMKSKKLLQRMAEERGMTKE